MAGRARKLPKEVQAIFDKYIQNNVRKLKKPDALTMLQTEFDLEEAQAEEMFNTFDQDKNGVMSIWEFQQFYMSVGQNAHAIVEKFQELDVDGSGKLDLEEARVGMKEMQTVTGRPFEDKEIDFFLKNATDEDQQIDLGHFCNLLFRLKMYKPKPPKK